MLSSLRMADGRVDWIALGFGRIFPIVAGVLVLALLTINLSDPEGVRRMEVARCLRGVTAMPVITLPCTDAVLDESIRTFLARSENQRFEVGALAPLVWRGNTTGFKVVLREKQS